LNLIGRTGSIERLQIRIRGDEINPGQARRNHRIDRVAARAPHPNDFDADGQQAIFLK
jgi:hypothetical protein